jgi:hypothetical protein
MKRDISFYRPPIAAYKIYTEPIMFPSYKLVKNEESCALLDWCTL